MIISIVIGSRLISSFRADALGITDSLTVQFTPGTTTGFGYTPFGSGPFGS